ncbi:heparinase II/III domain-containing protein [Bianquea renquensis]|uniref:Heparinase II/III family protein n=1 Tax=Bianquea renquensis TaxID=2763661 RepID=A0A926DSZ4_9FIRM|nr:heparinase II/III family protein [Bianquea renquensis]MBC8542774.1 heparinase II/III family protein [Bianquea renquensis]
MRNVPINYAETILEPYWDSGESYPDNEKYSVLQNYQVCYHEAAAKIFPYWCGVRIAIEQQLGESPIIMERDCDVDLAGYDELRVFASFPKNLTYRLYGEIDGEQRLLIHAVGDDDTTEYVGTFSGTKLTHLRYEFQKTGSESCAGLLCWLGLANRAKREELEAVKSPYDSQWEGCFAETYEIKPMLGIYFDEDELPALRKKLTDPLYASAMKTLRQEAEEAMKLEPEADIQTYIGSSDHRWIRNRDWNRPVLNLAMEKLAFVGILDENIPMLKMACRMALSVAHSQYWCESFMGVFPGATWHHRSFTEEVLLKACAKVLDWAGALLTWHGRHILYDAMIMKGLPRLEADFKTVSYIRHMNQGIVFNVGRIVGLLALVHPYPRYESWLLDAEKDMKEMIDSYVASDGGTPEGPGYWNYTFSNAMTGLYLLARYHHKTLKEYVWDTIRKTADFAPNMLSDQMEGCATIPFNDGHSQPFKPIVSALFCQVSDDPRWKRLYEHALSSQTAESDLDFLIMSPQLERQEKKPVSGEGFASFPVTGLMNLRQKSELGMIHISAFSGVSYFAHYHEDKGSFLLEVDGKPILIDRGVCTYSNPYVATIGGADVHNLFYPESNTGFRYHQKNSGAAKVTEASFQNGILRYRTELQDIWEEGIMTHCSRSLYSEDPCVYWIADEADYITPHRASFRLNTRGEIRQKNGYYTIVEAGIQVSVYPIDYQPQDVWWGPEGYDETMDSVNQLRLYLDRGLRHRIRTVIEVSAVGEEQVKVLPDGKIQYKQKIYSF